jgi:alpha-galactosidase
MLASLRLRALLAVLAVLVVRAPALDNGLGATPPLGWNSWNHFGCEATPSAT